MAKHDKLTLNIAKAVRSSDYYVLKYSSTERGKVVDVTVKDTDNNPYDLTGLKISFVEELYNGNIVVDEDNFTTNADDLKNGQFSYQFRDEVYQYDGWAHFKFTKNENLIDTTAGFAIRINFDIDDELDEKSYVVYFENIKKEHQTALNSLRELISSAQSLNDSNHSEISVIKGNITDLSNRLNDQVGSLNQRITDVNNALSGRVDTLNEATNNLKNTDADLQSQINNKTSGIIITDYDIASKTPTQKTDRYNKKWLVDAAVISRFADQINQLKGRRTADAPDFNTLTDTGVYMVSNPAKGQNSPSDSWGVLAVFNCDNVRTMQVYDDDAGDVFVRIYGWITGSGTWGSWNQIAWKSDFKKYVSTEAVLNCVPHVNLLQNSAGPFYPQYNSGSSAYQTDSNAIDQWQVFTNSTLTLVKGETYTLSATTNGVFSNTHDPNNVSNKCVIWIGPPANIVISGENTTTNTFTWNNDTGVYPIRVNRYGKDSEVKAWNIKIEKGSTATPWTPSPEDL